MLRNENISGRIVLFVVVPLSSVSNITHRLIAVTMGNLHHLGKFVYKLLQCLKKILFRFPFLIQNMSNHVTIVLVMAAFSVRNVLDADATLVVSVMEEDTSWEREENFVINVEVMVIFVARSVREME